MGRLDHPTSSVGVESSWGYPLDMVRSYTNFAREPHVSRTSLTVPPWRATDPGGFAATDIRILYILQWSMSRPLLGLILLNEKVSGILKCVVRSVERQQ